MGNKVLLRGREWYLRTHVFYSASSHHNRGCLNPRISLCKNWELACIPLIIWYCCFWLDAGFECLAQQNCVSGWCKNNCMLTQHCTLDVHAKIHGFIIRSHSDGLSDEMIQSFQTTILWPLRIYEMERIPLIKSQVKRTETWESDKKGNEYHWGPLTKAFAKWSICRTFCVIPISIIQLRICRWGGAARRRQQTTWRTLW